jgi:hypothetical protein
MNDKVYRTRIVLVGDNIKEKEGWANLAPDRAHLIRLLSLQHIIGRVSYRNIFEPAWAVISQQRPIDITSGSCVPVEPKWRSRCYGIRKTDGYAKRDLSKGFVYKTIECEVRDGCTCWSTCSSWDTRKSSQASKQSFRYQEHVVSDLRWWTDRAESWGK